MSKTTIPLSKTKYIRLIVCYVLLTLVGFAFLYYILFIAVKIKLGYLLLFAFLSIVGLAGVVMALKDLYRKDKTGLLVSELGLYFTGTPIAKKIGFVPWREVKSIKEGKVHGVPFIAFLLHNPQNYVTQMPTQYKKSVFENGLIVNSSNLETDHESLKRLVLNYFNKYN